MTEPVAERNSRDYYILDTRTPDTSPPIGYKNIGRNWAQWNLLNNEEYKSMVGMKGEKLKKAMSESGVELGLRGRPENFHDKEKHLTPDVAELFTENGFVWIHKDLKAKAIEACVALRKLDANVDWHPMGLSIPEDEIKAAMPVAPGGGALRGSMIPGLAVNRTGDPMQAPPSKLMGGGR